MTFKDLNLNNPLLNALNDIGFTHPTPIQEKVFSIIMSGKDLVGIAQTGTGKTLAYLLPCLRQWKFSGNGIPQILIIVPTRELVVQVVDEIKKLTSYMNIIVAGVYGGVNMNTQIKMIANGIDILVATPGRLIDITLSGNLRLKSIKKLVIDEVDEMLNLGFRAQLISIFEILPPKRQNLMFSATMTKDINEIINNFFNNPLKVETTPVGTPLNKIDQIAYFVPNFYTKVNVLKYLLSQYINKETKVLIFVSTKKFADLLYKLIEIDFANQLGIVHANKAQNNRFNTVKQFDIGKFKFLISTDIMARGLDIIDITQVINFDIPKIPEDYIHRIGRTGRANKNGAAITFVLDKEQTLLSEIETLMNKKISITQLPKEIEITEQQIEEEKPQIKMKKIVTKIQIAGESFHEKKAKNKKINVKVRYKDKMMLKYGKPITRGQKPKK